MPRNTSTPSTEKKPYEPVIAKIEALLASLNAGAWLPVDEPIKANLIAVLAELKANIKPENFHPNEAGYELNGDQILTALVALEGTVRNLLNKDEEASAEDEVSHYQKLSEHIKLLEKSFSFSVNPAYFKKKRRQSYAKAIGLTISILVLLAALTAVASIFIFPAFAGVYTVLAILAQFSAIAVLGVLALAFIFVPPPLFAMISDKYKALERTMLPISAKVKSIFTELKTVAENTAKSVNLFSFTNEVFEEDVSEVLRRNFETKRERVDSELGHLSSDIFKLTSLITLSESGLQSQAEAFSNAINAINQMIISKGYQGDPLTISARLCDLEFVKNYADRGAAFALAEVVIQQREELAQMKVVAECLAKKLEVLHAWRNARNQRDYLDYKLNKYKNERRTDVDEKSKHRFDERLATHQKTSHRLDAVSFGKHTFHLFTPYSKKITRELVGFARGAKALSEAACQTVISRIRHPKR